MIVFEYIETFDRQRKVTLPSDTSPGSRPTSPFHIVRKTHLSGFACCVFGSLHLDSQEKAVVQLERFIAVNIWFYARQDRTINNYYSDNYSDKVSAYDVSI